MIKFKNLGRLGVLALLFAFGATANAQQAVGDLAVAGTFTQSSNSVEASDPDGTPGSGDEVEARSSAPTVAAELFGPGTGVKLEFGADGFEPIYKLTYVQATEYTTTDTTATQASPSNSVEAADEGMITYTLSGATFAERVSPNDFAVTGTGGDATTITIKDGGAKDDPSVTVMVTVGGTAWDATTVITFTVPDLTATGRSALAPVRMSAGFSIDKTSNFPEGIPGNKACGEMTAAGMPASARGCQIVMAANYINTFTLGGASMGKIDLANRAKLISGTRHLDEIAIGTVTVGVNAAGDIRGQDGKAASLTSDLAGDVAISVASSQFRDGDIVYIDDNSSRSQDDARELFTISDGVAMADRSINVGSWTVRYIPNGMDALMHNTELTLSAMTDFTDRENKNISAKMGASTTVTTMLDLNGITGTPAMAYAIAPLDSTDTANVRITCEAGKACNAFLSCHDGMGMDYFGDEGIEIAANGTVRLDQSGVSAALGMMDGEGWSGRLSCEVLSTAPISVQVLTRAEGVLVNNTYVGEGGK